MLALAVLAGSQLLIVVDATIVNVALGPIRDGLGFAVADLQWVVTAYTLAFGGLLIPGGRLADRFGHRRVFLAGAATFGAASLVGGSATTPAVLVVARAVQGAGAASMAPAALALVLAVFPPGRRRVTALGVWAAATAGGTALGSILGGVLTQAFSWRWVLWINIPAAALVVIGGAVLPRTRGMNRGRIDLLGAAMVTVGTALLVYGLTRVADRGWHDGGTLIPLLLAGLLLGSFVVLQRSREGGLVPLEVMRNRTVVAADLVGLVLGVAIYSLFFFTSLFLSSIQAHDPVRVGLAFIPMTIAIAIAARLSGRLAGRIRPGLLSSAGAAIVAIGIVLLSRLAPDSSYAGTLLPALVIAGFGLGLTFVPLTSAAVSGVSQADAGIASALFNAGQQIGGAIGLAVLTTVSAAWTAGVPESPSPAATTAGWSVAFLVAAVLTAVAAVIAATLIRTSDRPVETP